MRRTIGFAMTLGGAVGLAFAAPQAPQKMPGEAVYQTAGCVECHGAAGKGTAKGPALVGVGSHFSREKILRQIREGGGEMDGFEGRLKPEEIDQVADWLVTWKDVPAAK